MCVCGFYGRETTFGSAHASVTNQSNYLPEVQTSLDDYQTDGAVSKLVCVYVKSFVFAKYVLLLYVWGCTVREECMR